MTLPHRSFVVMGAEFDSKAAPARRAAISECRRGDPMELRPTRGFLRVTYPIEVRSARGRHIGYIRAEQAEPLLARLDNVKAIFHMADTFGAVVRVSLDGSRPVLPGAASRQRRTPDWPPPAPRDDFAGI